MANDTCTVEIEPYTAGSPSEFFKAAFGFVIIAAGIWPLGIFVAKLPLLLMEHALPRITGFILVGILAGPFATSLLSTPQLESLEPLVSRFATAFIALQAGLEIYIPELKDTYKDALAVLVVALVCMLMIIPIVTNLAPLGFLESLGPDCRAFVTLMAASLMVCSSPAEAVAIVTELKAKGRYTAVYISYTIFADVVVITLYSIFSAIARSQCEAGETLGAPDILLVFGLLVGNAVWGLLLGLVFRFLLGTVADSLHDVIIGPILVCFAWGTFELIAFISAWSECHASYNIDFEGLLVVMVASSFTGHWTDCRGRMAHILHNFAPWVFLPFFTIIGMGLDLSALVAQLPLAAVLIVLRTLTYLVSSFSVNKWWLGNPRSFYNNQWMSLLPQAGVTLALAQQAGVQFRSSFGPDFSAAVTAVVVVHELVGPVLCSVGLRRAGDVPSEDKPPGPWVCHNVLLVVPDSSDVSAKPVITALNAHGVGTTVVELSEIRAVAFGSGTSKLKTDAATDDVNTVGRRKRPKQNVLATDLVASKRTDESLVDSEDVSTAARAPLTTVTFRDATSNDTVTGSSAGPATQTLATNMTNGSEALGDVKDGHSATDVKLEVELSKLKGPRSLPELRPLAGAAIPPLKRPETLQGAQWHAPPSPLARDGNNEIEMAAKLLRADAVLLLVGDDDGAALAQWIAKRFSGSGIRAKIIAASSDRPRVGEPTGVIVEDTRSSMASSSTADTLDDRRAVKDGGNSAVPSLPQPKPCPRLIVQQSARSPHAESLFASGVIIVQPTVGFVHIATHVLTHPLADAAALAAAAWDTESALRRAASGAGAKHYDQAEMTSVWRAGGRDNFGAAIADPIKTYTKKYPDLLPMYGGSATHARTAALQQDTSSGGYVQKNSAVAEI